MSTLIQSLVHAVPELAVDPADAALERALADAVARAHAAWPQLHVADDVLVGAMGRALRDAPDVIAAVGELVVEDLYLAQACAGGAPAALKVFGDLCDAALIGSLRSM